ncbi:MAG: hypothetical protein WCJ29_05050 [bacterium]
MAKTKGRTIIQAIRETDLSILDLIATEPISIYDLQNKVKKAPQHYFFGDLSFEAYVDHQCQLGNIKLESNLLTVTELGHAKRTKLRSELSQPDRVTDVAEV